VQLDDEFKEIDGAHLPVEYTDLLKKNHNPGIERNMEKRIYNQGQPNCHLYFG
jgi:hypothetical protein